MYVKQETSLSSIKGIKKRTRASAYLTANKFELHDVTLHRHYRKREESARVTPRASMLVLWIPLWPDERGLFAGVERVLRGGVVLGAGQRCGGGGAVPTVGRGQVAGLRRLLAGSRHGFHTSRPD